MKNKAVLATLVVLVVTAGVVAVIMVGSNRAKDSYTNTGAPHGDSSTSEKSNSTSSAIQTTEVEIEDYAYTPQVIKIKVGDTVTWTNKDDVRHDVVADKPADLAPSSKLLNKGESYSFTFTKAGIYTYHCQPHPYMKGTVIVE